MAGQRKILIVGGGLAGLTSALMLQQNGFEVQVFEKKKYPFHRVCGEYISNEALPFLRSLHIPISELEPSQIKFLSLTSKSGQKISAELDLGGFGVSRYKLDNLLFETARNIGVQFSFEKVSNISFIDDGFDVETENGVLRAPIVIGAFGKRSNLDQKLRPSFFYDRSPYMGVKYHIKTDLQKDLIRLDNFPGGYSGVCKIEDDLFNLCYLSNTSNLKNHGGIAGMEEQALYRNPFLKHLFNNSEFVHQKPEVINEISFEKKSLVKDHILFCGDSAGMIVPLCGNGMAMAFHSAKLLTETIIRFVGNDKLSRHELENDYRRRWETEFAGRLRSGRVIQYLFSSGHFSDMAVSTLKNLPFLTKSIIKKTHGKPF